jgi:hypothetical protein
MSGDRAPADEKVDVSVTIEIRRGRRAGAFAVAGKDVCAGTDEFSVPVVQVKPVIEQLISDGTLDAAGRDEQIHGTIVIRIEENRADVIGRDRFVPWLIRGGLECAVLLTEE